jgi:hypothetical protein
LGVGIGHDGGVVVSRRLRVHVGLRLRT